MGRNQTTRKGLNPTRLLTIACAVTLSVLAWLGWNSYHSYRVGKPATEQNDRLAELRGRILHLDEVLTRSARMAAATGEPDWKKRYRTFEPHLDAAIQEAKTITPEADRSVVPTAAGKLLFDIAMGAGR